MLALSVLVAGCANDTDDSSADAVADADVAAAVDALVEDFGDDGAFAVGVFALELGYSRPQLIAGARNHTVATDGRIAGVEADGDKLGLIIIDPGTSLLTSFGQEAPEPISIEEFRERMLTWDDLSPGAKRGAELLEVILTFIGRPCATEVGDKDTIIECTPEFLISSIILGEPALSSSPAQTSGPAEDPSTDDDSATDACGVLTTDEVAALVGAATASANAVTEARCEYLAGSVTLEVYVGPGRTIGEEREYAAQFSTWELVEHADIGDAALEEYQPTVDAEGQRTGQRLLHLYAWVGDRQLAVTPFGGTDWAPGSAEAAALLELARVAAGRL